MIKNRGRDERLDGVHEKLEPLGISRILGILFKYETSSFTTSSDSLDSRLVRGLIEVVVPTIRCLLKLV